MKLMSVAALGGAAVVTAPALWAAFVTEQMAPGTAVLRYLVAAVLAWVAFTALAALVGAPPRPEKSATEADPGLGTGLPPVEDVAGVS